MAAVLVDTNLLVYAHDPADPEKQKRSIETLDHLHSAGIGCFSAQTLAEFFAATTRGKTPLLNRGQSVPTGGESCVVMGSTLGDAAGCNRSCARSSRTQVFLLGLAGLGCGPT